VGYSGFDSHTTYLAPPPKRGFLSRIHAFCFLRLQSFTSAGALSGWVASVLSLDPSLYGTNKPMQQCYSGAFLKSTPRLSKGALRPRAVNLPRGLSMSASPSYSSASCYRVSPCLPTKTDKLPSGGQWLHEIKHDGFRVIARKNGAQVRLYSVLATISPTASR
jgi:hypothetical protein